MKVFYDANNGAFSIPFAIDPFKGFANGVIPPEFFDGGFVYDKGSGCVGWKCDGIKFSSLRQSDAKDVDVIFVYFQVA